MKYLDISPTRDDEAGYRIEDGIVVNEEPRRAYDYMTRYWHRTKEDLMAEEASWAARSGPVYIIKEGRKSA